MSMDQPEEHLYYLRMAIDEAQRCHPTPTAFCVGCVLVVRLPIEGSPPTVLAKGFSRELPGNTHAEANALEKAKSLSKQDMVSLFPQTSSLSFQELIAHADVYTTMEPCSVRTSGLAPCSDALIKAGIRRCFIGVGEPDDFVVCEGAQKLQNAGIQVIWLKGLESECLAEARRCHELANV